MAREKSTRLHIAADLRQLPQNIQHILTPYVEPSGDLKQLPEAWGYGTLFFSTCHGFTVRYRHKKTGEFLDAQAYEWKAAKKWQGLLIVSGRSLREPIIVVPKKSKALELKIFTGDQPARDCPVIKVYGDHGRVTRGQDKDTVRGTNPKVRAYKRIKAKKNRPPVADSEDESEDIDMDATPSDRHGLGAAADMEENDDIAGDDGQHKSDIVACICDNNIINENMVPCAKCDTWQHVDCYYPGSEPPEPHLCSDCRVIKSESIDLGSGDIAIYKAFQIPVAANNARQAANTPQSDRPVANFTGSAITATTAVRFLRRDGSETRTRSFKLCNTVQKLFAQAYAAAILTPGEAGGEPVLLITIKGQGDPLPVVREDEDDFAEVVRRVEASGGMGERVLEVRSLEY